ncbi:hypothetical protein CMK18_23970 [Candidatus Poribacteria bacterium]|nr:hypothetical protein [Candidatus Poribacteria bacterium]|tara:strand:+ start:483 stop:683 length:201 start_codon:yes stop_codon:yes gene_type:complete
MFDESPTLELICPIHKTKVAIIWSIFTEAFYVVDYEREMQAPDDDFETVEQAVSAIMSNQINWIAW